MEKAFFTKSSVLGFRLCRSFAAESAQATRRRQTTSLARQAPLAKMATAMLTYMDLTTTPCCGTCTPFQNMTLRINSVVSFCTTHALLCWAGLARMSKSVEMRAAEPTLQLLFAAVHNAPQRQVRTHTTLSIKSVHGRLRQTFCIITPEFPKTRPAATIFI